MTSYSVVTFGGMRARNELFACPWCALWGVSYHWLSIVHEPHCSAAHQLVPGTSFTLHDQLTDADGRHYMRPQGRKFVICVNCMYMVYGLDSAHTQCPPP